VGSLAATTGVDETRAALDQLVLADPTLFRRVLGECIGSRGDVSEGCATSRDSERRLR
jgi:hypothetical protein